MNGETRLTVVAALATLLTAVSLYPLFLNAGWFIASLGAVVVAAGAAELTRRLSGPPLLAPPAALVALLCYLTALFAGRQAWLGFIPSPDALAALAEITGRGFSDIQRYAAPVPSFSSITLITAGSIGLVAVLVDVLAVRARKAALAGLPLLAVFSVTSAIRGGAGWLAFCCAALGFCVLLMTDARERMGRWGRRPSPRAQGPGRGVRPIDTATLAASGRRIGFTAMAVAVVLPAVIPELPGRTAVSGWLSGLGAGGGLTSTIQAPSPLVSLKRDLTLPADRAVLRYQTKDSEPGYLRLYTLSEFNGQEWSMASLKGRRVRALPDGQLADPPGQGPALGERVTTRVTVDRMVEGLRFVPLPYPARRVEIQGQWKYDLPSLMVFSGSDVAGGRSYTVTSWDLHPSRERLNAAPPPPDRITDTYLRLPDDVPDLVRELAFRVTDDAGNAYAQAMALQEWFTDPSQFTYSLDVQPGSGSSALVDFLRQRVGYCEQFASAMAVMARVLGIPARVSVGYTAGTQQADGSWVVSTHDAHAWPELYFEGTGWLRFEPTPAAGGQPTATLPSYAQPQQEAPATAGSDDSGSQQDSSTGDDSLETLGPTGPQRLEQLRGGDLSGSGPSSQQPAPGRFPVSALLAVVVAGLLACAPAATRRAMRWRRWARAGDAAGRAHAAWAELRDDARDLGVPWRTSDTPRAAARKLTAERPLGDAAAALTRMTGAEERARYAPTPGDYADLRADSAAVRKALAASVGWPRRMLSWILPASTLQLPQRLGIWLADGLNWLDTADARLRALIRRRRAADNR